MEIKSKTLWLCAVVAMVVAGTLAFTVFDWDGPTDSQVRREFLAENPEAKVLAVTGREHVNGSISFEIRYQKPDGHEGTQRWLYHWEELNGKWMPFKIE